MGPQGLKLTNMGPFFWCKKCFSNPMWRSGNLSSFTSPPPLTSERPRRWTWSKIQNWGENPEMRNQPSIIKPMISLQYTSFLDFHLNSGFWTPSRFPPLPQNLLRLPDICKKYILRKNWSKTISPGLSRDQRNLQAPPGGVHHHHHHHQLR